MVGRFLKSWLSFQSVFWSRRLNGNFMKPDFLIIGAQRAGTTSLFHYLMQHPSIREPLLKEIHYFDLNSHKSPAWYFAHFPLKYGDFITGEASPYYLYHPEVPARVAELLPSVKLIVLLRNPIDRAYSNYQHSVQMGVEKRRFIDAIQHELNGRHYVVGDMEHREQSYLARGFYAEQLERWAQFFPKEQVLTLISEAFFREPAVQVNTICQFLRLSPFPNVDYNINLYNASSYSETLSPSIKDELALFFHSHNKRLVHEFGLNIEDWSRD